MKFRNPELSWLSFNHRVLQESLDKRNPLFERIKFLGIYSNNLDEFFKVRVANIKRMMQEKIKSVYGFNGTPEELLNEIKTVVLKQQRLFELSYQKILKELGQQNIRLIDETNVSEEQKEEIREYYVNEIKHLVMPILLDKRKKFPELRDDGIYLAVKLNYFEKNKTRYALIEVPPQAPRFFRLKEKDGIHYLVILDDIIRIHLHDIFKIFNADSMEAYTFKFSRDAEIDLEETQVLSLVAKMSKGIKDRKKGNPVRMVYDGHMPTDLVHYLMRMLGLREHESVIPGGKYHNFRDFMNFPDFGNPNHYFTPQKPNEHPVLQHTRHLFKHILKHDELLHFPYQKFGYIIDLLREAAIDPKVESISINIYRAAKDSKILNALIAALKNGKRVTVVFELLARFDEENNLYWSTKLDELGATVIYGVPGFKVHSKLLMISRVSSRKRQVVVYVGTGNFHEKTARIYEDIGLLTGNSQIVNEVKKIFRFFENNVDRGRFSTLIVSPFNARRRWVELIDEEIAKAKKKQPAAIFLKLNSLVDEKMILKLYEASKAGVKIRILCRGMCSLVPGIDNQSENIKVRSVVGRYLEHSRVFIFGDSKKEQQVFIGSSDWMARNLDKRVEVVTPILDENLKEQLNLFLETMWLGNQKARIIDALQKNEYVRSDNEKIEAQMAIYEYYKNKANLIVDPAKITADSVDKPE
jgi:polyphosphate kinase